MTNDNHLLSVPCYNGTKTTKGYYNDFFEIGQQKINFSFFELCLPDDDPVYTLKNLREKTKKRLLRKCVFSKMAVKGFLRPKIHIKKRKRISRRRSSMKNIDF